MHRLTSGLFLCLLFAVIAAADSWPQFRGPNGDGKVDGQNVPIRFSDSDNVSWKTPLPGKAWSSPVVADGVVWLTTAIEVFPTEEERIEILTKKGIEPKKFKQLQVAKQIDLKVLSVDLESGAVTRTIDLTSVEEPDSIHSLNSYASPTPVIDGDNIYCHFGTYGTFCLSRETGTIKWQRKFPLSHSVGPGSSPLIHGDSLVLIQDGINSQYVVSLNKATGETLWKTDRPEMDAPDGEQKKAYSTPIAITDQQGRDQLICMASQWMVAYEPKTGAEIWKVRHGKGFSVVPRPVYNDGVVYFATGFGSGKLWAVSVDGAGDVTDTHFKWESSKSIPSKPSPLLHDGLIYVIADDGIASCFDAESGDQIWKKRIGGKFSASPLFVGGYIYLGSHEGVVTVLKPGKQAVVAAENKLPGQIMASPAVVDNALILRTSEALYRIESK
ncbi:PQQ-binding-like beta-propeller repeat protein [Planctomycetes bacterium K23_9]|uniref:Serine/threonine-protein kinase AfsK n=1 Tax=Stieleria marina TaxID=1930275 RepID=A0A517NWZ5_9BACT|nr:Serine/threonine-protein kinase AfsK [Planctomycetes bacterium K23_9]